MPPYARVAAPRRGTRGAFIQTPHRLDPPLPLHEHVVGSVDHHPQSQLRPFCPEPLEPGGTRRTWSEKRGPRSYARRVTARTPPGVPDP
jgi:hypothetical protein